MSWKVEIKPSAEKSYRKMSKDIQKRIKEALKKLESSTNPFLQGNVRPLTGELKGDYRLRVGDWRILFTPDEESKFLYVYAILPKGKTY
jgi:mRNA interferase RelE/StbE